MLISPQLQNSFYQGVQPPQAASTPACPPHKQPGFGWKGTWPCCWVQCRVCTELGTPCRNFVSQDFTTSLSERHFCCQADDEVPQAVTQGARSRAERPNQFLCLSSQHQTPDRYRKALQDATTRCAQNSLLQESQGSRACSSPFYSEGQQCCLH